MTIKRWVLTETYGDGIVKQIMYDDMGEARGAMIDAFNTERASREHFVKVADDDCIMSIGSAGISMQCKPTGDVVYEPSHWEIRSFEFELTDLEISNAYVFRERDRLRSQILYALKDAEKTADEETIDDMVEDFMGRLWDEEDGHEGRILEEITDRWTEGE